MLKLLTGGAILAALAFAGPAMAQVVTVADVPTNDVAGFGGCGQFHLNGMTFAVNTATSLGASEWATVTAYVHNGQPMTVRYNPNVTLTCNPLQGTVQVTEALSVGAD